jgi:nickel/cobalt transporter (NicO) family protein
VNVPAELAQNLERAVGVMLFGLGVWLLWTLAHEAAHQRMRTVAGKEHDHDHDHHHDRRGSFFVGMAHGLAGTAPLIGVIPVAFIEPRGAAIAYLALFSAGTIAAMALFAGIAGTVLSAAGRASARVALALRFGAGIGSTVLGAVWFVTA